MRRGIALRISVGKGMRRRDADRACTDAFRHQSRHFVEVRQTLGGPAPVETARAIADAEAAIARDRAWLAATTDALTAADERLRERSAAL